MRTAFYFDEDVAYHQGPSSRPDLGVLRGILAAVPTHRRHVHILRGTLGYDIVARSSKQLDAVVEYLLGIRQPAWTTLAPQALRDALGKHNIAAFVVRGLLAKDSRAIHASLQGSSLGYLGAIQVQPGEISWLLYDSSLPPVYRIVGNQLRLMYRNYEVKVEDNRDHGDFQQWKESGLFDHVSWEDTGLQGTFFDPYDNPDHARMTGESEELVSDQMARIVDEIILRVAQLDPRLVRQINGALKAFDTLDTGDSLAHVSVSCRRLLERLADALFPACKEKIDGRKVGQAEYRNRLWAYINKSIKSHTQRDVLLSTLEDVGRRVDSLDAVANKGLHADLSPTEVQRLLIGLLTLIYDILTLTAPLATVPEAPYAEYASDFARELLRNGGDDDPDTPLRGT